MVELAELLVEAAKGAALREGITAQAASRGLDIRYTGPAAMRCSTAP